MHRHTTNEEDKIIKDHHGLDNTEALLVIIGNLDDAITGREDTINQLRQEISDLDDEIKVLRSNMSL